MRRLSPQVGLTVAALAESSGGGLFLAASAIYFTQVVGLAPGELGTALGLAAAVALASAYPLSRLGDRTGHGRMLAALHLWRGTSLILVAFADSFLELLAACAVLGVAQGADGPVLQAVVGAVGERSGRVRTLARLGMLRNIGFSAGVLAATPFLGSRSSPVFVALLCANGAASLAAGATVLMSRLPPAAGLASSGQPAAADGPRRRAISDRRLRRLSAANGCLALHATALTLGVPVWVVTQVDVDWLVGGLLVLNTGMVIALQVRLSGAPEGLTSGIAVTRRAGAALAAAAALFAAAALPVQEPAVIALLGAAIVVHTLGEIWQGVGAWTTSYALSPPGAEAEYITVFEFGFLAQTVAGPVFVGGVVLALGAPGWLLLSAVYAVVTLLLPVLARESGFSTRGRRSATGLARAR